MVSKSFSLDMTVGLPVSLRLAEPQRLPPRVELYRCRVASPACACLRVDSAGTLACRAAATVSPLMYSGVTRGRPRSSRSEEHTSELQSLMRISYAVFCLKKKKLNNTNTYTKHVTKSLI